jgi:isoquinoline 1-oxidoreductase alpha subunit
MIELHVNGRPHACESSGQTPLLWVLREELGYTGVKFGCGTGACGACTVHLDGEAVRSCVLPAGVASKHRVVTIEGLPQSTGLPEGELHPVQQAWIAQQVPQCGYCQSGMIMAAAALLRRTPRPTDAEIDAAITNLCRCGTYPRVRRAIHQAARG